MALAKGARQQGATIIQGVAVTDVAHDAAASCTGVRTDQGDIEAEFVVNCAGMWARQLGEVAGVNIPLQAAEHYYLITEQIEGLSNTWPVIEDPANFGYYREEVGGLMIGLFESVCAPWNVDGDPERLLVRRDPARLGPHGPVRRAGDEPRADLDGDRHPHVLLRARELHARPAAGRRRGAGAEELLRRRRA